MIAISTFFIGISDFGESPELLLAEETFHDDRVIYSVQTKPDDTRPRFVQYVSLTASLTAPDDAFNSCTNLSVPRYEENSLTLIIDFEKRRKSPGNCSNYPRKICYHFVLAKSSRGRLSNRKRRRLRLLCLVCKVNFRAVGREMQPFIIYSTVREHSFLT